MSLRRTSRQAIAARTTDTAGDNSRAAAPFAESVRGHRPSINSVGASLIGTDSFIGNHILPSDKGVNHGERRSARGLCGNPVRMKIAEVGDLSTQKARARAKEILGKIAKGADPREKKRNEEEDEQTIASPTLRQA